MAKSKNDPDRGDETAKDAAPNDTYGLAPIDDGEHPAAESPDRHSEDGPPGDVGTDAPVDEYGITPAEGRGAEALGGDLSADTAAEDTLPLGADTLGASDETIGAWDNTLPPAGGSRNTSEDTLGATDDTPLAAAGDDSLPPEATPAAALGDPVPVRETVVKHKGGFVPMVLGGIVAAALGFAAARYGEGGLPFMPAPEPDPFIAETESRLTQQDERVAGLDERLQEMQGALDQIDVDSVVGAVDALVPRIDTLAEGQQTLIERLDALEARMTQLEKQPMEQAVSPEAIAAYESELASLRDSLEAQRAEVERSRAEIESIAQTARQSEESAARQAQLAEQRATLAELIAALQAGRFYEEPLNALLESGVAVPTALTEVDEEGIPTPAQLVAEYPDAARDALRAARVEEDTAGGVRAFLRNQLGARSVTPQLGDDADAILSRAEAAVRRGNLEQALAEIEKLPEPAQAEMADWVAMARTRAEALDAASGLSRELNE
ncbi:COG4223 family protein [Citreimonas salinaria]|uniref:Inner membrane protein n=1 Tax=Citreimonas salinaria TaxID=321339 RepID=A0A1H3FB86_9RHOB|nr:mitofilin family membrane protein [Citreimonas salinaria]SDX87628.1 hypothetical protein SAMN05444340_101286 [Citreimonas salinaria]